MKNGDDSVFYNPNKFTYPQLIHSLKFDGSLNPRLRLESKTKIQVRNPLLPELLMAPTVVPPLRPLSCVGQ